MWTGDGECGGMWDEEGKGRLMEFAHDTVPECLRLSAAKVRMIFICQRKTSKTLSYSTTKSRSSVITTFQTDAVPTGYSSSYTVGLTDKSK